jgi:Kef-type K+ transport system membrane component KefB
MSKKTNTLWFILGATVFNVLIVIISFVILLALFVRFFLPVLPENAAAWGLPVMFVGAFALAFVIYRLILKQILKRVDMEKHFDPLFGRRRPSIRKDG